MKQRVLYFDILNVLSCFCVVCMHCNGFFHDYIKDDWWWMRVFIEVICFFAVPVFFMLSGATLVDYRDKYSTKTFIRKRLYRTFIPYFVWSIIFYSLYIVIKGTDNIQWKDVLSNFSLGKIPYTNYWFFIPLFLIYTFMPFLSLMRGSMTLKHILYLCLLLAIFQSVLPTIFSILGIEYNISLPIGSFVIYVFIGYYISHSKIEKNKRIVFIIGLLALISIIIRYILVYSSEAREPALFSYFGLYAILPPTFFFLLCKRIFPDKSEKGNILSFLSSKSLGIYLIHTSLISLIGKIINREEIVFIPISIIFAYILSIVFVSLMQKNRILKILVP